MKMFSKIVEKRVMYDFIHQLPFEKLIKTAEDTTDSSLVFLLCHGVGSTIHQLSDAFHSKQMRDTISLFA